MEIIKNLKEVSWNDSGIEVIRPNTEGQENSKSNLNITW